MSQPLAYYNEHDPKAAAWLRHLIEEGAVAPGVVDERSIAEIQLDDLAGFDQCHFFAGIGVWSYALRLAGWPDNRPVWTGSCPCQPFSAAGKRLGFEDPRHLWPTWFRLVCERRPDQLFGEQSDDAGAWIDLVAADLEDRGYTFGAADIPAAGFGGAHIRQRFYWVADANNTEWWSERAPWHDGHWPKTGRVQSDGHARDGGAGCWLADADGGHAGAERQQRGGQYGQLAADGGFAVRMGDPEDGHGRPEQQTGGTWGRRAGPTGTGPLGAADWLYCRDGLWRPVEAGTFPLVDEAPARLGRLRGYGNALDAEVAANFIGAYLDSAPAWGVAA